MDRNLTHRNRKRTLKLLHFIALFLVMSIICILGLWIVLNSFRPSGEIMAKPPVWSPSFTLDHYRAMFGVHAFALYRFNGKNGDFVGLMLFLAVPGVALSLPLFIVFARVGIIDTHFGLILAYVAMNVPFAVWLTDGFFRQIPKELHEAAEIDGCTRWQAFWRVEFPVARSGVASAAIFAFLTSWNEFALASQLTRPVNSKTMPVGLLDFTAEFTIDWGGMCALAVLMIVRH